MVIRTVGEDFEPRAFKVFGPVAFAWLVKRGMHVAQTLEDRSITIELRRRLPEEKITRLRSTRPVTFANSVVALRDGSPTTDYPWLTLTLRCRKRSTIAPKTIGDR